MTSGVNVMRALERKLRVKMSLPDNKNSVKCPIIHVECVMHVHIGDREDPSTDTNG